MTDQREGGEDLNVSLEDEAVSEMYSRLTSESGIFVDKAKDFNRQMRQLADKFQSLSGKESRKLLLFDDGGKLRMLMQTLYHESFDNLEECRQYCDDHPENMGQLAEVEAQATETFGGAVGITGKMCDDEDRRLTALLVAGTRKLLDEWQETDDDDNNVIVARSKNFWSEVRVLQVVVLLLWGWLLFSGTLEKGSSRWEQMRMNIRGWW